MTEIAYERGVQPGTIVRLVQVMIDGRWCTVERWIEGGLAELRAAHWERAGRRVRLLIVTGPRTVGKLPN